MSGKGTDFSRTVKVCAGYPRWESRRKGTDADSGEQGHDAAVTDVLEECGDSVVDDKYRSWAERFWSAFRADVGGKWSVSDVERREDAMALYALVKKLVLSVFAKRLWMLKTINRHVDCSEDRMGAIWVARFAGILFDAGIQDDKSLLAYATCVLSGIKEVRSRYFVKNGEKKDVGRWQGLAVQFVDLLTKIVAQINDDGEKMKWRRYVRHYQIVVCDNESDVAEAFSRGRLEYGSHREDREARISYAWLLHDCLNLAIRKYKKENLVKLFSSEMTGLTKEGLPCAQGTDIGCLLQKDLKTAGRFLSGAGAAEVYVAEGAPEKAMAVYREVLARDVDNLAARIGLVRVGVSVGDLMGVYDTFISLIASSKGWSGAQDGSFKISISSVASVVTAYIEKLMSSSDGLKNFSCELAQRKGKAKIYRGWRAFSDVLSLVYIAFVKNVGDFLTQDDRRAKRLSNGREVPSLSERVCRCLYQCATIDGVRENPLLMDEDAGVTAKRDVDFACHFLEKELSRTEWVKDARYIYGSLLLAADEKDEARKVFIQVLQRTPALVSAWIGLGKSFGVDSVDFAACMCKALSLDPQGRSAVKAHEGLAVYYEKKSRETDSAREYLESDGLRRKFGWRVKNLHVRLLVLKKQIEPSVRDENEFGNLVERANSLVDIACSRTHGVVVVARNPRASAIRVFWRDGDSPSAGHYAFVGREQFGEILVEAGMPVTLLVAGQGERKIVAGVEIRADGSLWDVFPREKGVVVGVDANRGFATMAMRGGQKVVVPFTVIGDDPAVEIGQVYDLGVLHVDSGDRVLFCHSVSPASGWPDFVREFAGLLEKKHRHCLFGWVGEVFVPKEFCAQLVPGTEIRGMAVQVIPRNARDAGWQAVAVEKQFKEVDSVLRS